MISDESVAWFLMTEGSLYARCSIRSDRSSLECRTESNIANTDEELIGALKSWLEAKGIRYSIAINKGKNYPVLMVRIRGNALREFLTIVFPFLLGVKREVARLVLEFFSVPKRVAYNELPKKWNRLIDISTRINRLNRKAIVHREKFDNRMNQVKSYLVERSRSWEKPSKTCEICQQPFTRNPAALVKAKYCSLSCKNEARRRYYTELRQEVEVIAQ